MSQGHRQDALVKYGSKIKSRVSNDLCWGHDQDKLNALMAIQAQIDKATELNKAFAGANETKVFQLANWQACLHEDIQRNWCTDGKLDPLKTPTRTALWIWEGLGSSGKTVMADFLCQEYGAFELSYGKASDIRHQLVNDEVPARGMYVINLTRNKPQDIEEGEIFTVIEELQDGKIRSLKYQGGFRVQKHPAVIIFANWAPTNDGKFISKDRLCVMQILEHQRPPEHLIKKDRMDFSFERKVAPPGPFNSRPKPASQANPVIFNLPNPIVVKAPPVFVCGEPLSCIEAGKMVMCQICELQMEAWFHHEANNPTHPDEWASTPVQGVALEDM